MQIILKQRFIIHNYYKKLTEKKKVKQYSYTGKTNIKSVIKLAFKMVLKPNHII